MQRDFYYDSNPECKLWDNMWQARTVGQELEACDIETSPRELFLKYLSKGDKVVDAGCGFGKWVNYLHRRGYDILGVDSNEYAVSKLKEFDSTLRVEKGDILNIKYPDNYFDAYISMGVVEHFEEGPQAPLREAYRLVKPGGLIFVSVPGVNLGRFLIRKPVRDLINALPVSRDILKMRWRDAKVKAILLAIINLLPESAQNALLKRKDRYCHFIEYRYTRGELEGFLKLAGFEIMETVPHDYYDSDAHSVGLWVDYPILREPGDWSNFKLNQVGQYISQTCDKISPWMACGLFMCVAKSLKKE